MSAGDAARSSRMDAGLLLFRLVDLLEEESTLLDAGDWEIALEHRARIDDGFDALRTLLGSGGLDARHADHAMRVHALTAANLAVYEALRDEARGELGVIASRSRLGGYAPLGDTTRRAPRYLDRSA